MTRPAITGDAKALREALNYGANCPEKASTALWLAASAIDLPEPEPMGDLPAFIGKPIVIDSQAQEEPDYSCQICGKDSLDHAGRCQCGVWSSLAAANRRIKELERERDESQQWLSDRLQSERDAAYAKGAEDFRESVADAFDAARWITASRLVRDHPIPKPYQLTCR